MPVAVVRAAMSDAFVKAVLYYGKDITTVAHFGRHIPAEVASVLALGEPPDFPGAVCSTFGCGQRHNLEIDHVVPYAAKGPTSLDNLDWKCYPCHVRKTDQDRRAGLIGPKPPGGWADKKRTGRTRPSRGAGPGPGRQTGTGPEEAQSERAQPEKHGLRKAYSAQPGRTGAERARPEKAGGP